MLEDITAGRSSRPRRTRRKPRAQIRAKPVRRPRKAPRRASEFAGTLEGANPVRPTRPKSTKAASVAKYRRFVSKPTNRRTKASEKRRVKANPVRQIKVRTNLVTGRPRQPTPPSQGSAGRGGRINATARVPNLYDLILAIIRQIVESYAGR